ncbi:(1-_4)-alpha-D-glucan synthase (ADP-glucose) [Halobellus clavatus]|uniref:(1->4)-alpha-D-glucan synthase (ADP-glucose) n=2 Tax=Halobellus clavatus TaxID=660517 RepID=A0A1H3FA44_9EURY|nr:(1->4)-alpha-D-glucan synthase (ADP-glucose) [Halobellus clavatus]
MPPKVLMLGWGFPPNVSGGLDTHVGELFDGMRDRGVDVELVLPAEYAPEGREGIVGVPTGDGDIITRVGRMSSTFAERAEAADVIHTHDWFGYGPGSRAKSNADVEWVTTFHSLSNDRNVDPPKREVETERRLTERADHLVAVSELTANEVHQQYGGDPTVIYNGFSECETTGRDYKTELGIDGEMLFFVGRHTDQKGISHLVYALEKLRRDDVTLVMGGSGHLTAQLKRFAELLGVADRIEWVGYVPEEELGDYYASADLFVSPSLAEPFGITITEALSAGTRVVATRSGVNEVLSEECVVEVDPNSESIAAGIERGLELEGTPEYDPITWDEVVEQTVSFYEDIV